MRIVPAFCVLGLLPALGPAPAVAQQLGLHCTANSQCDAGLGCGAGSGELTVFVNPLGNPDQAIVHFDRRDAEARRVDGSAAFTFRAGESFVSLQFLSDYTVYSMMITREDAPARMIAGTCEAL